MMAKVPALQAEIERLRAALAEVVYDARHGTAESMEHIARAALAKAKEEADD